jgi:hypothetical protein
MHSGGGYYQVGSKTSYPKAGAVSKIKKPPKNNGTRAKSMNLARGERPTMTPSEPGSRRRGHYKAS